MVAQRVKNPPAMQETQVKFLSQDDTLGTHSSILAWWIPWTEEPGELRSMGSQGVGDNWATNTHTSGRVHIPNSFSDRGAQSNNLETTEKCTRSPAALAKSLQSCPTLCDPIDGNPPGLSVPGILQAGILVRVAISFSNACMHAKSLQSCPTLYDPMDSSPPGSSVHGIL